MVNNNPDWQSKMQLLQVKTDGIELRDQLVLCIKMCHTSHSKNVKDEDIYYADLIEWEGGQGVPLPPGWILNPTTGEYEKVAPNNNEGENNG